MARIAAEAIERLREEIPVARLAELTGVKLRPEGENLVGSCPFHPDERDSLAISPEEN